MTKRVAAFAALTILLASSSFVLRAQLPVGGPQLSIEEPSPSWHQTLHARGLPANATCDTFIGGVQLGLGPIQVQFGGRFSYGFPPDMFPSPFPRPVSLTCGAATFTGIQETEAGIVALSPSGFLTFDAPVALWQTAIRGSGLPPSCGFFSLSSIAGNIPTNLGLGGTDASGGFWFSFTLPPAAQTADSFQWVAQPSCGAAVLQGANPGGPYPRVVALSAVEPSPGPQLVIDQPVTNSRQTISGEGLPANPTCDLTLGGVDAGVAFLFLPGTFSNTFTTTNVPNVFPRSVLLGCGGQTLSGVQTSATGTVPLDPAGSLTFQAPIVSATASIRGRQLPPACASFVLNHATGGVATGLFGSSTNAVGEFSSLSNYQPAVENADRYQWVGQGTCAVADAFQGPNPGGPYPRAVQLSPFKPTPTINWTKPSAILSGTALGSAQLNARTDIPGTFVYTPSAGTALPVGTAHVLSVTFTPSDTTKFETATKTVEIDVLPLSLGARFTGRISDAVSGQALSNVTILAHTTSGVPVAAAVSDASGEYATPPLAPGLYVAKASGAPGFLNEVYREISCIVSCNVIAGARITLATGQTRAGIDFTLSPVSSVSTLMWTQKVPAINPPPRSAHAMAYDRARGQMVLFGGSGNGFGYFDDTWVWDGTNWSEKSAVNRPPPLYFATMAYDESRHEVVLFGGATVTGSRNETWVWDGTNWTQKHPANSPPPVIEHAMAYDAARGEVVLFGGIQTFHGYRNDTWTWNGTDWKQETSANRPTPRALHAMAFDEELGQVVLFGGHDGATQSDTWIWDGGDWTEMNPANRPLASTQHVMAFDAERGEVLLFGGGDITTITTRNDTWGWDGANWTKKSPVRRPPADWSYALAYDPDHRQVVLFGGKCCAPGGVPDTWVWDSFSAVKAMPAVTWATPLPIPAGTPLGAVQLSAAASVPGSFAYGPSAGTILAPGNDQILSVTFTPADTANYEVVTSTVTIDVVDLDTTPPEVTVPANLTVEATSAAGAVVSFSATATDAVDGPLSVTCGPESGSVFGVGATPVTCSATDAHSNTGTATFTVAVVDTIAPAVLVTSPLPDVMPVGSSLDVLLQASDLVGVSGVTVNGVAATSTGGSPQVGSWRATVPIVLPVPQGGVLRFDVAAADAAGNAGTAARLVDTDGISQLMDRGRTSGVDESDRYSNDFNTTVTTGTLARNGWISQVSAAPTFSVSGKSFPNGVRTTVAGAGTRAVLSACTGAVKELWFDRTAESADVACDPATGTMGVRVIWAAPLLEFREQLGSGTWQTYNLRANETRMSVGSPATADPANPEPIDAQLVQIDDQGHEVIVGSYQLLPGASVDVSVRPGGVGAPEEVTFEVLAGTVTVTVGGETRNLGQGEHVTLPITGPVQATPGKLTGEGRVDAGDLRYQFAFQVSERASGAERGRFDLEVDRVGKKDHRTRVGEFRSTALDQVVFWDDPSGRPQKRGAERIDAATFSGLGRWNGIPGYSFMVEASDQGEPGRGRDRVSITIRSPLGSIVATVNGRLDAGNIQSSRDK